MKSTLLLLTLKFLTVDITNGKAKTSQCINEDISNLKSNSELHHNDILGKELPLAQTDLVNKWVWHDGSWSIGPIGVILNGPCPLFCLLEEWQNLLPTPTRIAKLFPLIIVMAMATEVNHPV